MRNRDSAVHRLVRDLAGMLTEVGFALALVAIGLLVAAVATGGRF